MFKFFFDINRTGLVTFCGSQVDKEIEFDVNGPEVKNCFRKFENGQYGGGKPIITRHPNIMKSLLIGKRGWGLWRDQWSDGIVEHTFTREEILKEFSDKGIEIPESLLKEFDDFIKKKKQKKLEKEIERLHSGGMWK